ncbi:putative glycolipid-binding domain-containing protein [Xanthomonas translucens]|uniref:putative glycolipid-binding domain-containing protein n=1 Tax=Xanthomonas campestris pv. translucens TaxID=343 RepID=UPI002715534C|nr:putative glycolipid-binding domain-containing protein [Xanthomonas translucens]WLA02685.1 putative glycolipid-binding domain-containing protein [Xanthomonas translucens]
MHTVASILWRRLDAPGHDACRLQRNASAWQLDGAAVFRLEHGRIGQLQYRVQCDLHWHTQRGTVRGWLGGGTVDLAIARDVRGHWKLNGRPVADVSHCIDLDLGFTPATNLLQLRRLRLAVGEGADAPAAPTMPTPTKRSASVMRRRCVRPVRASCATIRGSGPQRPERSLQLPASPPPAVPDSVFGPRRSCAPKLPTARM